jgi:neutral ceramidase
MRAAHAVRDITPPPGITLSGFASRRNQSSRGIDDPLFVHALAMEQDGQSALVLVFDLLALGAELTGWIRRAVEIMKLPGLSPEGLILCCTHTHSAPATIELLGCGVCENGYWRRVLLAATAAAGEAMGQLRPVRLQIAQADAPGVGYNRRAVLESGRVSMAERPDSPVLRRGPTCDRILLARLCEPRGESLVSFISYAAHPCVVGGPNLSADFPGELRRRLREKYGGPFVFLQGAGGNVNLPSAGTTRREMLADVDRLVGAMGEIRWGAPVAIDRLGLADVTVPLTYQRPPPRDDLAAFRDGMAAIAATGTGPPRQLAVLADILNVAPGQPPDDAMMRHIAAALEQWSATVLRSYGAAPSRCDLAIQALCLGPLALGFVAAEVFAETALAVQDALAGQKELAGKTVATIGYAAPLVGYLPTDGALTEGGYEVEYAYRFYNHPAPFAKGSEPAAVRAIVAALRSAVSE